MHLGERAGNPRVIIDGNAELSAVRNIVAAFAIYSRAELSLPEDTLAAIDKAAEGIDDSQTVTLHAQASTQVAGEVTHSFGEPFKTVIEAAVSTFEQRPELLEPHMDETTLLEAQTFFPPTQS